VAGIDVHKKVLMVVVIDATTPEEPSLALRRRIRDQASKVSQNNNLVAGLSLLNAVVDS
jgi:hypothetical protein